jgi:hypothetical protein
MTRLALLGILLSSILPGQGGDAMAAPPPARHDDKNNIRFHSAPDLDLGLQTEHLKDSVGSLVPLGPGLVAGEGPHESNTTLIRVYNRHQARTAQFLSFPPTVNGGVNVAGAKVGDEDLIVATPISCDWLREVRVFRDNGSLVRAILVLEEADNRIKREGLGNRSMRAADEDIKQMLPPYVMATGRFLMGSQDEQVAVASRYVRGSDHPCIRIYDLKSGELLGIHQIPWSGDTLDEREIHLAARRGKEQDSVLVQENGKVAVLDPNNGTSAILTETKNQPAGAVFGPVFRDELLSMALPGDTLSEIAILGANDNWTIQNVGERENRFYYTMPDGEKHGYGREVDGRYIKPALHAHWRFDHWPGSLDAERDDPGYWGLDYHKDPRVAEHFGKTIEPTNFQPGFINGTFNMEDGMIPDPERGVPSLLKLKADNTPRHAIPYMPYGELTEKFYFWRFRPMAANLAVDVRRTDPDLNFIGMSPMHEIGSDGDYNPQVIRDFRTWLLAQYGSIDRINERFGTSFTDASASFDAPRNQGRGDWDKQGSAFWNRWVNFTRYTVMTMQARGYRECLLAGFPPESLKGHMIPDTYVWGTDFTGQDYVSSGGCPIEYMLSAGTSFGATRYALMFKRPFNWLQGVHSSGHNTVVNGEYGVYTEFTPEEAEQQTKWLFENGLQYMLYTHPDGMYGARQTVDALAKINADQTPRPGVTGGVGQITGAVVDRYSHDVTEGPDGKKVYRATNDGTKAIRLVSLGEGESRQGLIKSVDESGKWDGMVYLQPFHARVEVINLADIGTEPLVAMDPASQPVKKLEHKAFQLDRAMLTQAFALFHNDQFEVRVVARKKPGTSASSLLIGAYQDASPLPPAMRQSQNVLWLGKTQETGSRRGMEQWMREENGGFEIPDAFVEFAPGPEWQEFRYTFVNGLTSEALQFLIAPGEGVEFQSFEVTLQREMAARAAYGVLSGTPHRGGIRFDVLSRKMVTADAGNVPDAWQRAGLVLQLEAAEALLKRSVTSLPQRAGDPAPRRVWTPEAAQVLRKAIASARAAENSATAAAELAKATARFQESGNFPTTFSGRGPSARPAVVLKGAPEWVLGSDGKAGAIMLREVADAVRISDVEVPDNCTLEIRLQLPAVIYNHGDILHFPGAKLAGFWLDLRSLQWIMKAEGAPSLFGPEPKAPRNGPGFDPTKWYQVSMVKNGEDVRVYVDGREVASGKAPEKWNGRQPITLGGGRQVVIDEVRLWSRPLTADELAASAAGGALSGKEPGLIGVWDFNEASLPAERQDP